MQTTTIGERFRIYTRSVGLLLLAISPGLLLLFSPVLLGPVLGIISLVWIVSVLAYFPFYISRKLNLSSKPLLFGLPVAIISFGLLAFKVIINETAELSCLDHHPDIQEAMLNYLGIYCWTSILIWEVYLIVRTGQLSLI